MNKCEGVTILSDKNSWLLQYSLAEENKQILLEYFVRKSGRKLITMFKIKKIIIISTARKFTEN